MVKMIDNYTLLQVIGQGNYGKVYRAKNIKNNQQYAIKIIPSEKLHQNSKLQQCTMNQVQTLTTIGQTNHIIMYYQMLKTKNNYYFVYEFCNGGTLMQMISKQHHLEEKVALDIFKQLLQAFKVLNKLNIMHRDLKPENIFFTDNKVKLGDFGFCKGLRPEQNLTKTMLGSPIYMAPQVLKGQAYSTKADIWSLGVILYEMLYAVCPFQSSSIAMLINTINSHEIVLPANIKVSQKTQQLIKKLLTKDYFRRIGWIELFNWFDEESEEQKQNLFNNVSLIRSSLDKKTNLIEEWADKNKISELNVKERSISQDLTRKDRSKFDMVSLQNISPSKFQPKAGVFTPKLGQQNKNSQKFDSANIDSQFSTQNKSYSVIQQPSGSSPFQGYRKPASLPKRQTPTNNQTAYGHSSCFRLESSKKIFYSQNYQNIFSTPITEKSDVNEKSIQTLQRDVQTSKQNPSASTALIAYKIANKNRVDERMSLTKNSLINSRVSSSITSNNLGSKNTKQGRPQNQRHKRKQLLHAHQQCLIVLRQTYRKLQEKKQKYLRIAFLVLSGVLEKLKEITKSITIAQIDLLDIASLINYEIIQVDRMVIDIREQIQNNLETVPNKMQEVQQAFQSNQTSEQKVIKNFIHRRTSTQQSDGQDANASRNAFIQNICINNMLPKVKQEEKQKCDNALTYNQESTNTIKYAKSQYHTTNQFAQYYKNLVQSKEKNTTSKIAMS